MVSDDNFFLEKRGNPRIGLEVQAAINNPQNSFKMLGWIQDISQSGFKFKIDTSLNFKDFFRKGDEIFFETFEDFFQLKGRGGIVWTSSMGDTAGIRFNEMPEVCRNLLDEFLLCFNNLNSHLPSSMPVYNNSSV